MKNNRSLKNFLLISLFVVFLCPLLSGEDAGVVLDSDFFKELNRIQLIQRDDFFDGLTNRIVIGRGIIKDISVNERYKKKYRLIIESTDSAAYNQKVLFFVFLENKNTIDLLTVDSKFEFKGQFMGSTPLGTKRNDYILDIILMDGSTVIE